MSLLLYNNFDARETYKERENVRKKGECVCVWRMKEKELKRYYIFESNNSLLFCTEIIKLKALNKLNVSTGKFPHCGGSNLQLDVSCPLMYS